jgi:hypothetical protein
MLTLTLIDLRRTQVHLVLLLVRFDDIAVCSVSQAEYPCCLVEELCPVMMKVCYSWVPEPHLL